MVGHELLDGITLAKARITEAQVAGNQLTQPHLFDAQLGIAALAVADDEQAVLFHQLLHCFLDLGVADVGTGTFMQMAVFPLHAPLQQGVTIFSGQLCKENVRDFGHHLAEDGLQHIHIHAEPLHAFVLQLGVVALGHQRTGIPQGAVNIKNQTFKIHFLCLLR